MDRVKLSRLDRRVLRLVRDAYPIPYDPDNKEILAVGERPLVTDESLHAECVTATASDIRQVTEKLRQFQLIRAVYLCDEREFHEQYTGAGNLIRHVVAGPAGGPFGKYTYQVTTHGVAEIEKFLPERLKRMVWKAVEERGGVVVVALLTAFATWFLTRLGCKQ